MSGPRGVVRLLNTADGRVLCLAGEVDAAAVDAFLWRYGREPARIDRIDAGSVTALSTAARQLLVDHLAAAQRYGRVVEIYRSPAVETLVSAVAQDSTTATSSGKSTGNEPNSSRPAVAAAARTSPTTS